MKEIGIEVKARKTVTKGTGSSKGGTIGKKEREILNMTRGSPGFDVGPSENTPVAGTGKEGGEKKKKWNTNLN